MNSIMNVTDAEVISFSCILLSLFVQFQEVYVNTLLSDPVMVWERGTITNDCTHSLLGKPQRHSKISQKYALWVSRDQAVNMRIAPWFNMLTFWQGISSAVFTLGGLRIPQAPGDTNSELLLLWLRHCELLSHENKMNTELQLWAPFMWL